MVPARLNPFRTERVEALSFRFRHGWDWARLFAELDRRQWRAAIVGPHGSGKTTLLLQLADWLVERRQPAIVRRLGEESDGAARRRLVEECALMAPNAFLMLDGAEQLGWLSWRRLMGAARHLRGLLITVHVPGRLPTLYECSTSPALLRDLGESLAGSTQSACTVHDWEQLHRLHDGNLRDALRSCYQQLAG